MLKLCPTHYKLTPDENMMCTGCKSIFRKIFELKNWRESMFVLKYTIPQQKALDLSFDLPP